MLDRDLTKSIFISFMVHIAILAPASFINFKAFSKAILPNKMELTYFQAKDLVENVGAVREPPMRRTTVGARHAVPLHVPPAKKEAIKPQKQEMPSEELPKTPKESIEKKIIPKNQFVELDKNSSLSTDPAYMSYYHTIREKIRECALLNYKQRSQEGQVLVSFSICRDGSLTALAVQDDRSDPNDYLIGVAKRSIAQSAPFKPFPAELSQQEIAFNVVISFSSGRLNFSRMDEVK